MYHLGKLSSRYYSHIFHTRFVFLLSVLCNVSFFLINQFYDESVFTEGLVSYFFCVYESTIYVRTGSVRCVLVHWRS